MLDSPDGKQGSLCCLPGGGALKLLPKVGQVVALQHAKRDLKHLLQTLLPANCSTVQELLSKENTVWKTTLLKKKVLRAALAQGLHDEMLSRQHQQVGGALTALERMSITSCRAVLQRPGADETA